MKHLTFIYCALLFLNNLNAQVKKAKPQKTPETKKQAQTQVTKKETSLPVPLIKVIRNTSAPDSNTAFIRYDDKMQISTITEYIKKSSAWQKLSTITYHRFPNGNIKEITEEGPANVETAYQVLSVSGQSTFYLIYDSAGNLTGRNYTTNKTSHTRFDYNADSLVIREVFIDNNRNFISAYWQYKYDSIGRIIDNERFLVNNYIAKSQFGAAGNEQKFDPNISFADPFLFNRQHLALYSPFRRIQLSYRNNAENSNNVFYTYNTAGLPDSLTYKYANTPTHVYQFSYLLTDKDYTWEEFLVKRTDQEWFNTARLKGMQRITNATAYGRKRLNYGVPDPVLDLRNGVPPDARDLINAERSTVLNTGTGNLQPVEIKPCDQSKSYEVQAQRAKGQLNSSGRFIQLYADGKKNFRLDNFSRFPVIIKISGHKDVFLKGYEGALYAKANIDSGTSISVIYPDTSYRLRQRCYREESTKLGGHVINTIDNIMYKVLTRNREEEVTHEGTVIAWDSETGEKTKATLGDEQDSRNETYLWDALALAFGTQAKITMKEAQQALSRQYTDNELFYAASLGAANTYTPQFKFQPVINYIHLKFKERLVQ